ERRARGRYDPQDRGDACYDSVVTSWELGSMDKRHLHPDGTWCSDPAHFNQPSRRDFLYVGLIGGLGLTLGDYLGVTKVARAADLGAAVMPNPKAQAVIHIFLPGGMAAQETFDPKPYAPVEYRGAFGTIKSKIDGEPFGELLPRTAGVADKITVIRS